MRRLVGKTEGLARTVGEPGDGGFSHVLAHIPEGTAAEKARHIRRLIRDVEDYLLWQPQVEDCLDHVLMDGLYIRTMRMPLGTMLTGALHKKACLTILSEGDISILTEGGATRLQAPLVFSSEAGVRRLGYCHTEVVWSTVHATTATTLRDIEDELFEFHVPDEED